MAAKAYDEGRIGTVKNPRKAPKIRVTYKFPRGIRTIQENMTISRTIASVLIPIRCFWVLSINKPIK